jgi:hypothetical protein
MMKKGMFLSSNCGPVSGCPQGRRARRAWGAARAFFLSMRQPFPGEEEQQRCMDGRKNHCMLSLPSSRDGSVQASTLKKQKEEGGRRKVRNAQRAQKEQCCRREVAASHHRVRMGCRVLCVVCACLFA